MLFDYRFVLAPRSRFGTVFAIEFLTHGKIVSAEVGLLGEADIFIQ